MTEPVKPILSARYAGRFAVAAPEFGIPYLSEASLTMAAPHDRHSHAEIQVLWVVEGEMGMEVGPDRLRVGPGGGLVLSPGQRHRVVPPGPPGAEPPARARIVDLRLRDDPALPTAAFARRVAAGVIHPGDPATVADAARRLRATLDAAGPARSARMMSAVWELLGELVVKPVPLPTPGGGSAPPGPDMRLAAAERYMADHLSDPIGVDAVAAAVGLSRSQLTRLAARHRGVGPAELLRRLRVDRARHLLRGSTLAIKEIARVCGFVSQNHFSRVYFEVTGTRPSAGRG
ncbi:MAG: AraC family transcriptional regulator [Phycisphaerales bacterium]|nr:AraC family transcriptional regulator [Phycisphaerales bacterium]